MNLVTISMLGISWEGFECSYQLDTNIANPEEFTRENITKWLAKNAGDFRKITDFSAAMEVSRYISDVPDMDDVSVVTTTTVQKFKYIPWQHPSSADIFDAGSCYRY